MSRVTHESLKFANSIKDGEEDPVRGSPLPSIDDAYSMRQRWAQMEHGGSRLHYDPHYGTDDARVSGDDGSEDASSNALSHDDDVDEMDMRAYQMEMFKRLNGGAGFSSVRTDGVSEKITGEVLRDHVFGLTPEHTTSRSGNEHDVSQNSASADPFTASMLDRVSNHRRGMINQYVSALIDTRALTPMLKMGSGFATRYSDVIKKAGELIEQVGPDSVGALQLYPQSHIDARGNLRGYTMLVKKSGKLAPILETMPDYGSGHAATFVKLPGRSLHGPAFDYASALKPVGAKGGKGAFVDLSDPASEERLDQIRRNLVALRQSDTFTHEVIPESFVRGSGLDDRQVHAISKEMAEALEEKRARMLGVDTLAPYNTSVGIHRLNNRIAFVTTNYAHADASMVKCLGGDGLSVGQFLDHPLRTQVIRDSATARAHILTQVMKETLNDAHLEKIPTEVRNISFVRQTGGTIVNPDTNAHVTVRVPEVDNTFNQIRPLDVRSGEYDRFTRHYGEERSRTLDAVTRVKHDAMMDGASHEWAVVFNEMSDFMQDSSASHSRKGAALTDLGNTTGFHVAYYAQPLCPVATQGPLFGVPAFAVKLPERDRLEQTMSKEAKETAKSLCAHAGDVHRHDIYPLQMSAYHDMEVVEDTFGDDAIVGDLHKVNHILRENSHISRDKLVEHVFEAMFRWVSSMDPSIMSLSSRYHATPNATVRIDCRHTAQVLEVFGLVARRLATMKCIEQKKYGILSLIQPGMTSINQDGFILSLNPQLMRLLCEGE